MSAPRDHSKAVGGLTFHYVTWGPESAPPLVLLHGLTSHARSWDALHRITAPTLLVRGADSDVLSTEVAKRMIDALPNGRLVEIPGAGHPVPLDQPEAFARAVRAFLGA